MRADARHNREQLLDAARSLVSGDRAPTLNELARHAGMGVATVYRHFADADALATALMEQPLQALRAVCERAGRERDPALALRALFVGALELWLANPVIARLIHAPETTSEPIQRALDDIRMAAHEVLMRARRDKVVRASISSEDICCLLLGVHAAAVAAQQPASAAHRYANIVLAGIAPVPRTKAPRTR
jgi:AcrR family transcriptional regulator